MKKLSALMVVLSCTVSPVARAQDKTAADWRTPTEICEYRCTPRYDETMAYIRRIQIAAPKQVKIEPWGKTGEGRELVGVIAQRRPARGLYPERNPRG